ncbi:MAG: Isochorismatase family protein [Desulfotomaculum sp. 46_296]|nr:MAG: Isochorismatase family protein [Desulfotomaculum sp. 46_296]HAU31765.1 hydrolase [Desulfotomaculum sp.]
MNKFRLKKEDTVLIIIDLQEKLLAAMPDRAKVCANTRLLLTLAEKFNLPVILTEQYPRGLGSTLPEITELLPEHQRLEKTRFSAFCPELLEILRKTGRHTIIMAGSETHVCVYQTTRDLLEQGFNVHIACDAVCSRFKENYENALSLMQSMGAVISNTETMMFDFMVESGHPHFRSISALLK